MTLIRTSFLNGIAVMIRMLSFLGINKILAIYVGPAGYGLVGQFQSAVQMISTFGSGAINTGVIRFTAQHQDDLGYRRKLWRTAGTISLVGSILTSLAIILSSRQLSLYFLKTVDYQGVFIWFGVSLTFFVFNTFFLAILNGNKELKTFVLANIIGSILSLVLTGVLTLKLGLYGALIALGTYQSFAFLVTLLLVYKKPWFAFNDLIGKIDGPIAKDLFRYTFMALSSAICVPLSHIMIRNYIGTNLDWASAGYWEAIWKLSAAYLMIITSTLSVYYLPRLSELETKEALKQEIAASCRVIIPVVIVFGLGIYFTRYFLIRFLFTAEFYQIDKLFFWQLIGDTLKITSWLFAYVFLAKGFMFAYVFSEVIFSILFYSLIVYLLPSYGLVATSIAHAINYAVYLVFVLGVLRSKDLI